MHKSGARISLASEEDVPAMLAVYRPYVEGTPITFETEVPSEAEFAGRLRKVSERFAWLKCEMDGELAGYAYASLPFARAAYQWDAELSVYLDKRFWGRGIASAFYRCLLTLLTCQGYRNVYGIITLSNQSSIALHETFGFVSNGILRAAGYKLGEWHDVIFLQKRIGEEQNPPSKPLPFAALDKEMVTALLKKQAAAIR